MDPLCQQGYKGACRGMLMQACCIASHVAIRDNARQAFGRGPPARLSYRTQGDTGAVNQGDLDLTCL